MRDYIFRQILYGPQPKRYIILICGHMPYGKIENYNFEHLPCQSKRERVCLSLRPVIFSSSCNVAVLILSILCNVAELYIFFSSKSRLGQVRHCILVSYILKCLFCFVADQTLQFMVTMATCRTTP